MFWKNSARLFLYHPDDPGSAPSPGGTPPDSKTPPPGGDGSSGSKGGQGNGDGSESDEFDFESLDPKTKAHIKKLRKEAADSRTETNKLKARFESFETNLKKLVGGEDDQEPPEKKLESLTAQSESLALENAILGEAVKHGIGADSLDYFRFCMGNAMAKLEEGEELSEEKFAEVVKEVKSKSKGGTSAGPTSPSSPPPSPGNPGSVTLDQFLKMTMFEKSTLYNKNPDLYQRLTDEAKSKGQLIPRR